MPDVASLLDLAAGSGYPVPVQLLKGDVVVAVPMDPPREVCVGRTPEPEPGDGPYVAFLTFVHNDDHKDAWEREYGDTSTPHGLLKYIYKAADGEDVEPELPTEVVVMDGGRVIRVDLSKQWPEHVLLVPERYVP